MWFITLSNRMAHLYTNLYTHESPEVRTRKEERPGKTSCSPLAGVNPPTTYRLTEMLLDENNGTVHEGKTARSMNVCMQ